MSTTFKYSSIYLYIYIIHMRSCFLLFGCDLLPSWCLGRAQVLRARKHIGIHCFQLYGGVFAAFASYKLLSKYFPTVFRFTAKIYWVYCMYLNSQYCTPQESSHTNANIYILIYARILYAWEEIQIRFS